MSTDYSAHLFYGTILSYETVKQITAGLDPDEFFEQVGFKYVMFGNHITGEIAYGLLVGKCYTVMNTNYDTLKLPKTINKKKIIKLKKFLKTFKLSGVIAWWHVGNII